jgi:hypothetical protein
MMRRRTAMIVHALATSGTLLGVTGCSVPLGSAGTPPSQEAMDACNTRADEIFLRQNRDALYKADNYTSKLRDTPFAGAGLPETSAGLSDQYARGQDVRHCLNGVATPLAPQPAATAAP